MPDGEGTLPAGGEEPSRGSVAPSLPGAARRPPPRPRPGLAGAIAALGLLIAIGGLALHWYQDQATPPGGAGPAVIVQVEPGWSVATITNELAREGVVAHAWVFQIYLALTGAPTVRDGTYQMHRHEAFAELRSALAKGPTVFTLQVPAGATVAQVANDVGSLPGRSGPAFLALVNSGVVRSPYEPPGTSSLEGLLGPGVYEVPDVMGDRALLTMMVDHFDVMAAGAGISTAPSAVGVTPYQAITVASLVAREAGLASDRGKVARVAYNRLARGMRLQFDSTVVYALGGGVTTVTAQDLAVNSPYNTYRVAGLPPTPISTVSAADLAAALHPTPGSWLYFVVVSPDGAEAFSDTYAGQLANIALAKKRGLL